MDLTIGRKGKLTGTNGVLEHILAGVIQDSRWSVSEVAAGDDRTNVSLLFNTGKPEMPGMIEITIVEY